MTIIFTDPCPLLENSRLSLGLLTIFNNRTGVLNLGSVDSQCGLLEGLQLNSTGVGDVLTRSLQLLPDFSKDLHP